MRALPADTSALKACALFLAYFGLALGLVAAAFIDAEHMYLPDSITIGGTVLGLATASLRGEPIGIGMKYLCHVHVGHRPAKRRRSPKQEFQRCLSLGVESDR